MKIVNKKKFVKSMLILIFILVSIVICTLRILEKNTNAEATEVKYTVSRGETLWGIAKKYKQENQDIREYIYEVKQINNLTNSSLYEGQVINIINYK